MRCNRLLLAAALGLLIPSGAATGAEGDDSAALTALRAEVIGLLREARPATRPTEGSDPWLVELAAGTLSIFNLARTVEGLEGAARREEILRFVDRALPPGPEDPHVSYAAIEKRLRLQIAPAEFGAANSPLRVLHRAFSDDLVVAYVVDHADRIEYVRDTRVGEWKVDRETIERTAVANLERALEMAPIEVDQVESGLGRHMILMDIDGYGAARILCPGYMARLHEKLGPHLFIGIPARDVLIVWTPGHASRKKLFELVVDIHKTRDHPLTRTVFVTDRGSLRPASAAELAD